MENFKNFKLTTPPTDVLVSVGNAEKIVLFLSSDSGLCWYEARKLFSDDTVKVQYDSAGIIRAVVDKPVPERGNTYAASMLWPENASVAEIAVEDYPEGVALDETWKYDEKTKSVYRSADLVTERNQRINSRARDKYAAQAALSIATLQAGIATSRSETGDSDALTAWQGYLCDLRDMTPEQLQQSPALFPTAPASIF